MCFQYPKSFAAMHLTFKKSNYNEKQHKNIARIFVSHHFHVKCAH